MSRVTYSASEYTDMILIYGECRGNAALALRTYRERYGDSRNCPRNPRTIVLAFQRIRENKTIVPQQERELPRPAREESEESSPNQQVLVFCPKCDEAVPHTVQGVQQDQTKILVAKVYHYFEQEYEQLKKLYGSIDLTPLSKFRQRTALATGVSESNVLRILKEEEERAARVKEVPQERGRKRARQASSDGENDSDDDDDPGEPANSAQTPEEGVETYVVKVEPPDYHPESEIYTDPLQQVKEEPKDSEYVEVEAAVASVMVKPEPPEDIPETTKTTAVTKPVEPIVRKGRKKPRKSEVTSTQNDKVISGRRRRSNIGRSTINARRVRSARDEESSRERETRLRNLRDRYRVESERESSIEREVRRRRDRVRHRVQRARESSVEHEARLREDRDRHRIQRENQHRHIVTLNKTDNGSATDGQHTQGEPSTAQASGSVPAGELDESGMLEDGTVIVEKFEIHEEGFS